MKGKIVMNEVDKVSVIIPTYKRISTLERAINSVLNQTYKNFEVIIVDDNDPDTCERKKTEEILNKYKENTNVIYIKHEKNRNGAAARNTGIKNSKGKYICFLDDDDIYDERKLEKLVSYISNNNQYGAIYSAYKIGNKVIRTRKEGNLAVDVLMRKINLYNSTLLFKKDILLELNMFNETFKRHQDVEILLRFFEKNIIGYVDDVLVEIDPYDRSNELKGDDLYELKNKYFNEFNYMIKKICANDKKLENRIKCTHYIQVIISYIKLKEFNKAFKLINKLFFKSPISFIYELLIYIKNYIKNRYK